MLTDVRSGFGAGQHRAAQRLQHATVGSIDRFQPDAERGRRGHDRVLGQHRVDPVHEVVRRADPRAQVLQERRPEQLVERLLDAGGVGRGELLVDACEPPGRRPRAVCHPGSVHEHFDAGQSDIVEHELDGAASGLQPGAQFVYRLCEAFVGSALEGNLA